MFRMFRIILEAEGEPFELRCTYSTFIFQWKKGKGLLKETFTCFTSQEERAFGLHLPESWKKLLHNNDHENLIIFHRQSFSCGHWWLSCRWTASKLRWSAKTKQSVNKMSAEIGNGSWQYTAIARTYRETTSLPKAFARCLRILALLRKLPLSWTCARTAHEGLLTYVTSNDWSIVLPEFQHRTFVLLIGVIQKPVLLARSDRNWQNQ